MKSVKVIIAFVAVLAIGGTLAPAQEGDSAAGFKSAKGRVTFRTYCASCHGAAATGDGNLAKYLNTPPADLTGISARRGGEFPREEIAEIIDGRRTTKGHGSRDMPVWGDVFQSPLAERPGGQEEEPEERAARKVEELVLFLESIQGSN